MADEPEVTTDEKPDYLDSRFDSVEAQAKAYADAEKEMHRIRAEAQKEREDFSETIVRMQEIQQEAPTQQFQQPYVDPTIAAAQAAMDNGDAAGLLAANAQVFGGVLNQVLDEKLKDLKPGIDQATANDREIALRMAEQKIAPAYGDEWAEIAPQISKRLADHPEWIPQNATIDGYAMVLKEQADTVRAGKILTQETQRESERQAKLQAQTLSGGNSPVALDTDEKKAAWQQIKDAELGNTSKIFGP